MVSADLIALADQYGIDIPENLNRRFIIAELLEVIAEVEAERNNHMELVDCTDSSLELPQTYNETTVTAILRNPVWLYIYWDISTSDLSLIRSLTGTQASLRVIIHDKDGNPSLSDSFAMPLELDCREQYVLIPGGKKAVQIELGYEKKGGKKQTLAVSPVISLPEGNMDFSAMLTKTSIPPMLALSGFHEVVRDQYINHRQTFSSLES
jgi:hypothetical protein